jgi:hypothetical protein
VRQKRTHHDGYIVIENGTQIGPFHEFRRQAKADVGDSKTKRIVKARKPVTTKEMK